MTQRILMIEDDHRLVAMVRDYLAQQGFSVSVAENIALGFSSVQREVFDLVLLDLMLPDGNGLDACRQIRALPPNTKFTSPNVAIVMLTAKGDPMDRVVGLEIGADDYVPNRLSRVSCWRAFARCCGGEKAQQQNLTATHYISAVWKSIAMHVARASTASRAK